VSEDDIVKAVTAALTGEFYVGQRITTGKTRGKIFRIDQGRVFWVRWETYTGDADFAYSEGEMRASFAQGSWRSI
jgi:hypothetical protein